MWVQSGRQEKKLPAYEAANSCLSEAIALAGLRPLGQVLAQLKIAGIEIRISFLDLTSDKERLTVAAVDGKFVLEHLETLLGVAVSAVGDPSVGLHQNSWAEIFVLAVHRDSTCQHPGL